MDVRANKPPPAETRATHSPLIDRGELRWVFSSLSHELCRPLTSLKAGFDLLLGEPAATFTPDQRSHLHTMVTLCNDMLDLTRSYLDYAAVVQGSRPLCLGTFTIGALIQEITRQFAPTVAARRVRWESRVDPPEGLVVTDAARCQQILGNLVSNALKYTPVGGEVRVSGRAEADSWSVTIADTGPGIPPESLEMVFQPFYRLPRDEHGGVEGNGLGLAICRELVTQLRGNIILSSVSGEGTIVTVAFPTETRPTGPTAAHAATSPSMAGSRPSGR